VLNGTGAGDAGGGVAAGEREEREFLRDDGAIGVPIRFLVRFRANIIFGLCMDVCV